MLASSTTTDIRNQIIHIQSQAGDLIVKLQEAKIDSTLVGEVIALFTAFATIIGTQIEQHDAYKKEIGGLILGLKATAQETVDKDTELQRLYNKSQLALSRANQEINTLKARIVALNDPWD